MTNTSTPVPPVQGVATRIWATIRPFWILFVLIAVALAIIAFVAPTFFGLQNLANVLRQSSIVGIVAVGMTIVILSRGIDLTVGSVLAVAMVSFTLMVQSGLSIGLAFPATLGIGMLIGTWNGLGIAFLRIPPFVMTLAGLVIFRGLALRIAGGLPRRYEADSAFLDFLGPGHLGPVPGPFVVFLGVVAIAWLGLRYLPFGPHLRAVGGNAEAARLAGVSIRRTLVAAYVICGTTAALAGIMTASRLRIGDPVAGQLVEMTAIAAVVIGGTSLFGGVGSVLGTLLGALLLGVVGNVLNLAGVSPFEQMMVSGGLIIVAVLVQQGGITRVLQRRETVAAPASNLPER